MKTATLFYCSLFLLLVTACKKELPAPLPTANFFVENNGCFGPCQVYFYDQSLNAVKWQWEFGNGLSSSSADDSTIYSLAGTYEVWLYSWNADNVKDSIRKHITIN